MSQQCSDSFELQNVHYSGSSSLDAQRITEDYRALFDAFESQNGAFGYDLLDLACGNRSCIGAARFSSDHSEGWESLLAFLDPGSTDPYSAIGAQLVDLGNGEMEYRFLFSIDPFAAVVGQHSGDGLLTLIRADEPTATTQPPEGPSDGYGHASKGYSVFRALFRRQISAGAARVTAPGSIPVTKPSRD